MGSKVQVISPAALATTALAFSAALAWNEAVSRSIAAYAGGRRDTPGAHIAYALVVTLLVVILATAFNNLWRLGAGAAEKLRGWRGLPAVVGATNLGGHAPL